MAWTVSADILITEDDEGGLHMWVWPDMPPPGVPLRAPTGVHSAWRVSGSGEALIKVAIPKGPLTMDQARQFLISLREGSLTLRPSNFGLM